MIFKRGDGWNMVYFKKRSKNQQFWLIDDFRKVTVKSLQSKNAKKSKNRLIGGTRPLGTSTNR